jgi:hypothetical protein
LLFGDPREKRIKTGCTNDLIDEIDYVFGPGQVFSFAYKSLGLDYKKLHQCFVLRALKPNDEGSIIPGINPGAEILLCTTGATSSQRFREILQKLQKAGIDPVGLDPERYSYLYRLLEAKMPTDYFVFELLDRRK